MYEIHHRRFFHSRRDFARIASGVPTLEEAKARRQVSGDLVVHADTYEVVKSDEWLWDWEKKEERPGYARKAIEDAVPRLAPVFDCFGYPVGECAAP